MTWVDEASCAGDRDPDAWFASPASEPERVARAVAICSGCSVQENCLDFALEIGVVDGIWGGLDRRDLRDLGASMPRTDEWSEAGVQADLDARRRSERGWTRSQMNPNSERSLRARTVRRPA